MASTIMRRLFLTTISLTLITFAATAVPISGYYVDEMGAVYKSDDGRTLTLVARTTNSLRQAVYYSPSGRIWVRTAEDWTIANPNDCAQVAQLPVIGFSSSRDQVNSTCIESAQMSKQLLQTNDYEMIRFLDVLGRPVKEVVVAGWSTHQIAAYIADISTDLQTTLLVVGVCANGRPTLIHKLAN